MESKAGHTDILEGLHTTITVRGKSSNDNISPKRLSRVTTTSINTVEDLSKYYARDVVMAGSGRDSRILSHPRSRQQQLQQQLQQQVQQRPQQPLSPPQLQPLPPPPPPPLLPPPPPPPPPPQQQRQTEQEIDPQTPCTFTRLPQMKTTTRILSPLFVRRQQTHGCKWNDSGDGETFLHASERESNSKGMACVHGNCGALVFSSCAQCQSNIDNDSEHDTKERPNSKAYPKVRRRCGAGEDHYGNGRDGVGDGMGNRRSCSNTKDDWKADSSNDNVNRTRGGTAYLKQRLGDRDNEVEVFEAVDDIEEGIEEYYEDDDDWCCYDDVFKTEIITRSVDNTGKRTNNRGTGQFQRNVSNAEGELTSTSPFSRKTNIRKKSQGCISSKLCNPPQTQATPPVLSSTPCGQDPMTGSNALLYAPHPMLAPINPPMNAFIPYPSPNAPFSIPSMNTSHFGTEVSGSANILNSSSVLFPNANPAALFNALLPGQTAHMAGNVYHNNQTPHPIATTSATSAALANYPLPANYHLPGIAPAPQCVTTPPQHYNILTVPENANTQNSAVVNATPSAMNVPTTHLDFSKVLSQMLSERAHSSRLQQTEAGLVTNTKGNVGTQTLEKANATSALARGNQRENELGFSIRDFDVAAIERARVNQGAEEASHSETKRTGTFMTSFMGRSLTTPSETMRGVPFPGTDVVSKSNGNGQTQDINRFESAVEEKMAQPIRTDNVSFHTLPSPTVDYDTRLTSDRFVGVHGTKNGHIDPWPAEGENPYCTLNTNSRTLLPHQYNFLSKPDTAIPMQNDGSIQSIVGQEEENASLYHGHNARRRDEATPHYRVTEKSALDDALPVYGVSMGNENKQDTHENVAHPFSGYGALNQIYSSPHVIMYKGNPRLLESISETEHLRSREQTELLPHHTPCLMSAVDSKLRSEVSHSDISATSRFEHEHESSKYVYYTGWGKYATSTRTRPVDITGHMTYSGNGVRTMTKSKKYTKNQQKITQSYCDTMHEYSDPGKQKQNDGTHKNKFSSLSRLFSKLSVGKNRHTKQNKDQKSSNSVHTRIGSPVSTRIEDRNYNFNTLRYVGNHTESQTSLQDDSGEEYNFYTHNFDAWDNFTCYPSESKKSHSVRSYNTVFYCTDVDLDHNPFSKLDHLSTFGNNVSPSDHNNTCMPFSWKHGTQNNAAEKEWTALYDKVARTKISPRRHYFGDLDYTETRVPPKIERCWHDAGYNNMLATGRRWRDSDSGISLDVCGSYTTADSYVSPYS